MNTEFTPVPGSNHTVYSSNGSVIYSTNHVHTRLFDLALKGLEHDPANPELYNILGAQRTVALPGPDPFPLMEIGDEALRRGDPVTALNYYVRARDLAPCLHEVYARIVWVLATLNLLAIVLCLVWQPAGIS